MKVNLHTHTFRCRHATGADVDYVEAALAAGYTKLGFSDHCPFPYTDGFFNVDKMEISDLPGYMASVTELKDTYAGRMEILLGLECEPVPEFLPYLRELKGKMDYLILGNHGDKRIDPFFGYLSTPPQLHRYFEMMAEGMETGLFLYVAHPDIMLRKYPAFDGTAKSISREICQLAYQRGIPLEYNLNGLSKGSTPTQLGYPYKGFWEIAAEENCTAVVGVDAHHPEELTQRPVEPAWEYLNSLGIRLLEDPMCQK